MTRTRRRRGSSAGTCPGSSPTTIAASSCAALDAQGVRYQLDDSGHGHIAIHIADEAANLAKLGAAVEHLGFGEVSTEWDATMLGQYVFSKSSTLEA